MNAKEKLRNALRAYDQIEPAEDAWERIEARAGRKPRPLWRGHALVAGLAVVVAMGAIVGVRLIADRDSAGVRLVTPVVGPTADVSLLPSPTSSGSPSASPSPSPAGDQIHYVSADGVWEFLYPETWFGPATAEQFWTITNYDEEPSSVKLPIQVKFAILRSDGSEPTPTLDELLMSMCEGGPRRQILECEKVDINGRTWGLVLAYSEEEDPVMYLGVRSIAGDDVFQAIGYVSGKSGHGPAIAQIREVFQSFELNV